jgi:curli production assembly/transport component CsgG
MERIIEIFFALILIIPICGCTTISDNIKKITDQQSVEQPYIQETYYKELEELQPPEKQIVVAVYDFPDYTGQRKQQDSGSSFSSSVTQGGASLLIGALKNAGKGEWFKVVERNRLDDLTKERQLIRTTRDEFQNGAKLDPLLFAGIILQGGIIGYDTNIVSGGTGARYLGIGMDRQYRRDQITVALRAVSTTTGEVLLNVQVSKTILSTSTDNNVFKFIDMGTRALELERGVAENEAGTIAIKMTIEAAVVAMIEEGAQKNYWKFKE